MRDSIGIDRNTCAKVATCSPTSHAWCGSASDYNTTLDDSAVLGAHRPSPCVELTANSYHGSVTIRHIKLYNLSLSTMFPYITKLDILKEANIDN